MKHDSEFQRGTSSPQSAFYGGESTYDSASHARTSSSTSDGARNGMKCARRPPDVRTVRVIFGCSTARESKTDRTSPSRRGRSSENVRVRLISTPTPTASTWTSPTSARHASTESKIARSRGGLAAKYSSTDIAGKQTCDWLNRPNSRSQAGQVQRGTGVVCSCRTQVSTASQPLPCGRLSVPALHSLYRPCEVTHVQRPYPRCDPHAVG